MALISLRNIQLAFGAAPLLDDATLQIDKGERICLLGRNGSGKSTLLKLIAGELPPDGGTIQRQQGLRVATLQQEVPRALQGTVYDCIAAGLDAGESWDRQQQIELAISTLKLSADTPVASLSGGVMRRVLLARALARQPDILLLDEPTNHLDIDSIRWLEEFLLREKLTLVFVTHDRAFLRRLATRIVELDRGKLYDFACDYDTFLERKEEVLHAESEQWRRFDKKLAEEEVWIRKGIKARRTRNEGRVRALKKMREEHRQRRQRTGTAKLQLSEAEKSGRLVAEVEQISFGYAGQSLIRDFSTTILRGDRVGIIGPNGVGKTTLLKLLLGQLQPQQGSVKLGTNLEITYFDQLREQLDPDKTVQQNLAGDQDTVLIAGQSRHVIGYLQDFLFSPDRCRTPVRILSGGERYRLLLAKLFTREANLLVLDEPTNDLDLETLDLLEELLAEFAGTIFLVSHDRDFLNRTVTSTVAFEGAGRVSEYIGGYDDWLRQRPEPEQEVKVEKKPTREKPKPARERKLSFKEKRELEFLPQQIEALETEQVELHAHLADPELYRQAGEQVVVLNSRLAVLESELETCYRRWGELDALGEN
jgi:ABC transport system ATP-binding/permease protein